MRSGDNRSRTATLFRHKG